MKLEWKRGPDGSIFVSVAIHVVVGALLLWILSIPRPFEQWLSRHKAESIPVERISFVRLPNDGTTHPGKSGGDGNPVRARPRRESPRLVPPSVTPSTVPPAPTTPPPPESGTGPVIGKGGADEGITPSNADPRIWIPPGPVASAPKSAAEKVDSVWTTRFRAYQDSAAQVAANAGRKPGDWTFEKNGKKYGIDQNKIYLGKFSVPSALLALLPLNKGANEQYLQDMHVRQVQQADLYRSAQMEINEDEFRDAVKRIRERKQKEREERMLAEKKKNGGAASDDKSATGKTAAGDPKPDDKKRSSDDSDGSP